MALANSIKEDISEALNEYAKINSLSQDQLSKIAGINVSYINAIKKGDTVIGKTAIQDSFFKKVAAAIGYRFESEFWKSVETDQFLDVYSELADAKVNCRVKVLIGETGCGKTYTINRFKMECPACTYVVTVSSLHRVHTIISELGKVMGLQLPKGDSIRKLHKIAGKLRYLRSMGKQPVIILDEAENLPLPVLKMLKGLYDSVKDYCPIVLIGTNQLVNKLEKLKENDAEGMPQFYRRFKAGIRIVTPIDKKMFSPFFDLIDDKELRSLLLTISDNYGELNDYLETALREATRMGEKLTEEFFRHLFKL